MLALYVWDTDFAWSYAGCVSMMYFRSSPVADWPPSAIQYPGWIVSRYGPHTPGTNTASGDIARWHVDVPATAARREKACDWSLFAAAVPSSLASMSTLAPTVPIQPAYASMTGLPMAIPTGRPSSLAAFSESPPTCSPALR